MDNENQDQKEKFENVVPPNLDEDMMWLFYRQKKALLMLFLLGGAFYIYSLNHGLLWLIVGVYVTIGFFLAQANEYYTIGYAFYRYFMSIYIEPLEYLKERGKKIGGKNKKAKSKNKKDKIRRKKTTGT